MRIKKFRGTKIVNASKFSSFLFVVVLFCFLSEHVEIGFSDLFLGVSKSDLELLDLLGWYLEHGFHHDVLDDGP